MKVIFSPKTYKHEKNLYSGGDLGYFSLNDISVFGERVCLIDSKARKIIRTKGNEKQVFATVPRCFLRLRKIRDSTLVLPGLDYSNYYHIVTDWAFQCYKASLYGLAKNVVLPISLVGKFSTIQKLVKSFGLSIKYIHTPFEALALERAVFFDKPSGRFGEIAKLSPTPDALNQFYRYIDSYFDGDEEHTGSYEMLFSTRRGNDSRLFEGISEVENSYRKKGYKVVYFGDKTIEEQIRISQNVIKFAGFHGANLANLMFAKNCRSMEEVVSSHYNYDFRSLCHSRGIKHKFTHL